MRRIEMDALLSFKRGEEFVQKNTRVTRDGRIELFGHTIVSTRQGNFGNETDRTYALTMRGYPTHTTRSRLNAFLKYFCNLPYGFHQKKGQQYFGNTEITPNDKIILDYRFGVIGIERDSGYD